MTLSILLHREAGVADLPASQHLHQPRRRGGLLLRPLPVLLQHPRQVRRQAHAGQPRRAQRFRRRHFRFGWRCFRFRLFRQFEGVPAWTEQRASTLSSGSPTQGHYRFVLPSE
jgi:hypothetical protein